MAPDQTTQDTTDPQQLTAAQMFDTLTGFDELAVLRAFRANVHELASKTTGNPFQFGRALVFVHRRRTGAKDADAYAYAMGLPMREALTYFADDPDAGDDDDDQAGDLEGAELGKAPQL